MVFGRNLNVAISSPSLYALPLYGKMEITSPVFILDTSSSIARAPESSHVAKNIGAIVPPSTTPPVLLLGTPAISTPKCHCTEFTPDLRLEPVPTTSPTYATGLPLAFNSFIVSKGLSIFADNIEFA